MYVRHTVEDRIMDLLKTRAGEASTSGSEVNSGASTSNGAGPSTSASNANLLPPSKKDEREAAKTMAGALKADRQNLRLNELDALFKGYDSLNAADGSHAPASASDSTGANQIPALVPAAYQNPSIIPVVNQSSAVVPVANQNSAIVPVPAANQNSASELLNEMMGGWI
jgi:hypothetical protein